MRPPIHPVFPPKTRTFFMSLSSYVILLVVDIVAAIAIGISEGVIVMGMIIL